MLLLSYLQRGLRSASDSSGELDIASLCARVNAEVMDALSDIEVSDNTEDNGMPPRKRTRRTRRPAVVVDDSDSHSDDNGVVDEAEWLAGYSKWKALVAGKKVPPPPSPPASWPAQPL